MGSHSITSTKAAPAPVTPKPEWIDDKTFSELGIGFIGDKVFMPGLDLPEVTRADLHSNFDTLQKICKMDGKPIRYVMGSSLYILSDIHKPDADKPTELAFDEAYHIGQAGDDDTTYDFGVFPVNSPFKSHDYFDRMMVSYAQSSEFEIDTLRELVSVLAECSDTSKLYEAKVATINEAILSGSDLVYNDLVQLERLKNSYIQAYGKLRDIDMNKSDSARSVSGENLVTRQELGLQ